MFQHLYIVFTFIIFANPLLSKAEHISILVTDNQGNPVQNAVVQLIGESAVNNKEQTSKKIDQRNSQFDPHIVAVTQGSKVSFTNYDSINHHVYSSSKIKSFEMKVLHNNESAPVVFDKPGVVMLGCNIHDWMLSYVFVSESPYHGTTDQAGYAKFDAPKAENYQIKVWHPRLNADSLKRSETVNVRGELEHTYLIKEELLPDNNLENDLDDFDNY